MSKAAKIFLTVFIVFFGLVFIGLITMMSRTGEVVTGEGKVARINLSGTIQEVGAEFGAGGITPAFVESQLQKAREQKVEAVVLRVNSPGGSVAASQEIAELIADYEKPVVVSMGDVAASGGYYISAPADAIVARPGTQTGSIGVIFTMVNPEGLFDKIGLEMETITSGEHKDMFNRELTEEERKLVQDLSDEAYNQFIGEIVEGRELSEEEVREQATGEVFMGSQAYELGLVDELGGYQQALELAGSLADIEDPEYYEVPGPSFFEMFMGYSARLPSLLNNVFLPEEALMMEKMEDGLTPGLEYRLVGY
ncbi:MAG: signal peptide peptidase SppA [Halanaerobiales bacterium]